MTERFRKMVDLASGSTVLIETAETYLKRHTIHFKTHRFRTGFVRYFVHEHDLCCARSVIPALKSMAATGQEVRD